MIRILFVCMGNICRSPMAEGVFGLLAARAGLLSVVDVDSAGTHTNREGESPDQRARTVAASRGYNLSGLRARRIKEQDFNRFDLILAMDRQNLAYLRKSCPTEFLLKLGLFMDYADGQAPDEVPDPYYGGIEGFEKVLDLCEVAAQGLIGTISRPGFENRTNR
jgi:protein-tyrosine phosphatase